MYQVDGISRSVVIRWKPPPVRPARFCIWQGDCDNERRETQGVTQTRTEISASVIVLTGALACYAQGGDSRVDVIVQYRSTPTAAHHNRVMARGGQLKHNLGLIRGAHYSIPADQLNELATDPDVEHISVDHELRSTGTALPSLPDYGWMTALGVSSSKATLPYDGTGLGVAVIDNGMVGDLPDLASANGRSRVVYQKSLVPFDPNPNDEYGHGTMVAGLIGGNGNQSSCANCDYTVRGIAPNVNIINLRVLDDEGSAMDSTVIAAIQEAIQLKNQYNIRVINLSLGRPVFESYTMDPLCQAVKAAWNAGIVVVVAAGNDGRDNFVGNQGYATINAPGNSPYVITVGAMNTVGTPSPFDDKITSYSSKGPTLVDHVVKPDLVAPGNRIYSIQANNAYLVKTYVNNRVNWSSYNPSMPTSASPAYFELSGTSMAAPMVSGAAALLLQQDATLTPDQVKARLMLTATKLPQVTTTATDPVTGVTYVSENDIFTIGAGYLNVEAALNTGVKAMPATSPMATFDQATNAMLTGSGAIWGTGPIWGTSAIWCAGAIWGTGTVQADSLRVALNGDN